MALGLFLDLHFLVEHLNVILCIKLWCFNIPDLRGKFPLALLNSPDHHPTLKVENYGPCDCVGFIIYHFLLI